MKVVIAQSWDDHKWMEGRVGTLVKMSASPHIQVKNDAGEAIDIYGSECY